MAKQICFDHNVRKALLEGVSKLSKAVKSTLGLRGRNDLLDKGWGSPKVTKDGPMSTTRWSNWTTAAS